MTSRSDLDLPATVIAAVIGVAIIAVALPFTINAFPETPKAYDVLWGERAADSKTLTVPTESGTYRTTVSATNIQPASVRVEIPQGSCNDSFNPNLQQQAASLRVKVTETRGAATRTLRETPAFPCSQADAQGTFTVALGNHTDIATASAGSLDAARRVVWLDAAAGNVTETLTYTVEVTASRPAPTIPTLPVTPTSLTASVRVTLNAWDAAVNEHEQEVLR